MIEISHKQAQHLIREAQDRRLPEEQWAILYAHLENCPDCRAYRERLVSYDRDLHRLLTTRWNAVRGPRGQIAERIISLRAWRKKAGKIARRASLYLLGILLVAGFLWYREVNAPEPEPPPAPTSAFGYAILETATPAPLQGEFNGLVVFETRRDGNAEIYLLNETPNGPQLTNLSENPAQDTQPVWSPDGQWIAFLSDRLGKNEVYITHVAGSRLTQVTNTPLIDWSGPLAWSYDGKWLGVSGRRGGLNGPGFLYLIPLDGSGEPRSIAYTYLAEPWMRFSPGQPALAYRSTRRPGGIDVVNTDTGWTGAVTLEDNRSFGLAAGEEGAFDWSPGGRTLAYIAMPTRMAQAEESGAQIRISEDIEVLTHQYFTGGEAQTIDTQPAGSRYRAVSWMPGSLIIASLVGSGSAEGSGTPADECWMIRLSNSKNPSQKPRVLPDICVTGGLEASNWSPDGKWLVVVGREPAENSPGEKSPAIYAVRLPEFAGREDTSRGDTLLSDQIYIQRLADVPPADLPDGGSASSDENFVLAPRVRPGGALMQFTPVAAKIPGPAAEPFAPPPQVPGTIAYSIQRGADSWIVRSRPDGRGYFVLTSNRGKHSCPRISPDGARVAYLSDEGSPRSGGNEVFVTGLDRKNTLQLTEEAFPPGEQGIQQDQLGQPLPRYDCPAWSPDSKYLAAVHRTVGQAYLAVIPVDGKEAPRFLKIEGASHFAAPVWVPTDPGKPQEGSNQILLLIPRGNQQTRLVSIDLAESEDLQPAESASKASFYDFDEAQHMALSPDGKQLGIWLVNYTTRNDVSRLGKITARLEVIDISKRQLVSSKDIPNFDPDTTGMGGLTWLPDGRLALARIDSLIGPRKTIFERYDPNIGRSQSEFEPLAGFDEVVYDSVWIEGHWAIFASESGLWAYDLEEAKSNNAAPAMLSGEAAVDVDWK